MGSLDKSTPVWSQTLQGVFATWGESRRLPFLCFVPSYLFFFYTSSVIVENRGGGCLWGWGCNCTPSDGVSGLGSLGSGEGEGRRKRERQTDVKEWTAPSGRVAMATGETDEWMTSQWRGGERVWNWFGGGARGGVSRRVFVGADTFLSPPYPGVSCGRALTGKAPLFSISSSEWRLIFFFKITVSLYEIFHSDNCLRVLTTCETAIERGYVCVNVHGCHVLLPACHWEWKERQMCRAVVAGLYIYTAWDA